MLKRIVASVVILLTGTFTGFKVSAQAELAPWGNLTGIRIEGQLMAFESSLCLVRQDWRDILSTGKEKQRPKYERQGDTQVVTTSLDQLSLMVRVRDSLTGSAIMSMEVQAKEDQEAEGIYECFSLADPLYKNGTIRIDKQKPLPYDNPASLIKIPVQAQTLRISSPGHALQLNFEEPVICVFQQEEDKAGRYLRIYISLHTGRLSKGSIVRKSVLIRTSGAIDKAPVLLKMDPGKQGEPFDGFGGNFRLQNSNTDPQVIQYCLDNLRVAWGRVEMPWRFWQPRQEDHPIDSAKTGQLHPAVRKAMEMAQRLSQKGMPIILSAWSAPNWAITGTPRFKPDTNGVWGNPLEASRMKEIYKSIADYITYLKDEYKVEIGYFSFNESDLGINIRLTGQEHAELIKGLGAYFEQRGLKTKMLLGDNSDATTYSFIDAALKDTSTYRYIGAVSFHSWRGWETGTLQKWADAAGQVKHPLIVAEGSIDAQAWGYPAIFEEPVYALEEINLYIRLLAICQPASILQWQLTADYSPLSGGGIFGNQKPLHPTQRFWNLKQLASTPGGLYHLVASSDKDDVTIAALGDSKNSKYSIHLVNKGAARTATLTGLPDKIRSLHCHITDKDRAMQEVKMIAVSKGTATFYLASGAFTTLSTD